MTPAATEVLYVDGQGSDYADGDTENGFIADQGVFIKWRTTDKAAGARGIRDWEVRGDDFDSLWTWVVGSWGKG